MKGTFIYGEPRA
jgi:hypothetical protein